MPEHGTKIQRFVAKLRAVMDEDWSGRAGAFFRRGISKISEVNEEYLHLEDEASEAPDLAWRAVQGLAGEKHAKAISDYAKAENDKIDLALKQRVLEDKVRQERATADRMESEAALAKLNEIKARAELARTLNDLGVAITVNERGDVRVLTNQRLPDHYTNEIFAPHEKRLLGVIVEVTVPDMGSMVKDMGQIQLIKWLCQVGDFVEQDQPIFEISTDRVNAEIPCPVTGTISEILVPAESTITMKTIVCTVQRALDR